MDSPLLVYLVFGMVFWTLVKKDKKQWVLSQPLDTYQYMKDLIKTKEAKSKGNLDTITSETTSLKSKLIAIVKQMILMFSKR